MLVIEKELIDAIKYVKKQKENIRAVAGEALLRIHETTLYALERELEAYRMGSHI